MLCLSFFVGPSVEAEGVRPPRWPWESPVPAPAAASLWPLWLSRLLDRPMAQLPPPPAATDERGPVVFWSVTRQCNLACRACHIGSVERPGGDELGTRDAMQLIRQLAVVRPSAIVFWGGEPLCRNDLFDLIGCATSLSIPAAVYTNGVELDRLSARLLRKARTAMVAVSVEGVDSANDELRGGRGTFSDARRALENLSRMGVARAVRHRLRRGTLAQLPEVLRWAREENLPELVVSHPDSLARGGPVADETPGEGHLRERFDRLLTEAIEAGAKGRTTRYWTEGMDCDRAYLLRRIETEFPRKYARAESFLRQEGGNGAGVSEAWLDPGGKLYPAPFWKGEPLCDALRTPLDVLWHERPHPVLGDLRRRAELVKGRCARCRYLDLCGAGSRVRATLAFDDPWASEPNCYLTDAEIGLPERLHSALDHVVPRSP